MRARERTCLSAVSSLSLKHAPRRRILAGERIVSAVAVVGCDLRDVLRSNRARAERERELA